METQCRAPVLSLPLRGGQTVYLFAGSFVAVYSIETDPNACDVQYRPDVDPMGTSERTLRVALSPEDFFARLGAHQDAVAAWEEAAHAELQEKVTAARKAQRAEVPIALYDVIDTPRLARPRPLSRI